MAATRLLPLILASLCATAATPLRGADASAIRPEVEALIGSTQAWLLAQQQPNGALAPGDKFTLGVTALGVDALCSGPKGVRGDDPRIAKAIDLLLSYQQPDGGIYSPEEGLGNYVTSLTLMALVSSGRAKDPALAPRIARAQNYILGLQNTTPGSVSEGGIGYGSKGPGHEDLSNTHMAVEALARSGIPASDPRMQKALEFAQRCQNLSSHNKLPWVNNDGGSVYSPEESKAKGSWVTEEERKAADPKLASYGGMTYALISTYVMLDLKADDPRVKAALAWVRDNYRFDANPGMVAGKERQGLFYYYMAMAKTFDLLDVEGLELKDGRKADWRVDLFAAIRAAGTPVKLADGSTALVWINSTDRWAEGMPNLTAAYMLKSLARIADAL